MDTQKKNNHELNKNYTSHVPFYLRKKIKWRINRISSDNILAINTFTEYVFISLLFRMFYILSILYPMIPWLMFYTRQHMYCETLCGVLNVGKSHNNEFHSCQYRMLESKSSNFSLLMMLLCSYYWYSACLLFLCSYIRKHFTDRLHVVNMYIEKWVIQNNFFARKAIHCMFYCVFFPVFGYFWYQFTKANGSDTGCEPIHKCCL